MAEMSRRGHQRVHTYLSALPSETSGAPRM